MADIDTKLSTTTNNASGLTRALTREDISETMQDEGYDVTPRTIRYWESRGFISRPVRFGRHVVHPADVLNSVRALAATRPAAIRVLREKVMSRRGQIVSVEATDDTLIVSISYKRSGE